MGYDRSYTEYQLKKRSWLRQFVRDFYLKATLQLLEGQTIDFGCGTGDLLRKLPPGSIGLEINPVTVKYCQSQGLNVYLYDPQKDGYRLSDFVPGQYKSLILSHVLEHVEQPVHVLHTLLQAAQRLGIRRVVVIVPGKKGFAFDSTHRTYIDRSFFKNHNLTEVDDFRVVKQRYFPINFQVIENFSTYLELQVIYEGQI
jgi:SAM-dependent methyltransferase